jgi:hypothetical protein
MNEKTPIGIRFNRHREVAQYVYPKRKPVHMACEHQDLINVTTNLDAGSAEDGDDYYFGA